MITYTSSLDLYNSGRGFSYEICNQTDTLLELVTAHLFSSLAICDYSLNNAETGIYSLDKPLGRGWYHGYGLISLESGFVEPDMNGGGGQLESLSGLPSRAIQHMSYLHTDVFRVVFSNDGEYYWYSDENRFKDAYDLKISNEEFILNGCAEEQFESLFRSAGINEEEFIELVFQYSLNRVRYSKTERKVQSRYRQYRYDMKKDAKIEQEKVRENAFLNFFTKILRK